MINVKYLQSINQEVFNILNIIFMLIILLLLVLAFYQLLLTIDSNIKGAIWQTGLLRSLGMNQNDIDNIIMDESQANILASCIIGCIGGYALSIVVVKELATANEMKGDYNFMWREMLGFISISLFCVYIGTKLCL